MKRCGLHWDELGNPKGTADIQYHTAEDAQKAIKDYNGAIINEVEMIVEYAPNRTGRKRTVGFRTKLGRGRKN